VELIWIIQPQSDFIQKRADETVLRDGESREGWLRELPNPLLSTLVRERIYIPQSKKLVITNRVLPRLFVTIGL